MRVVCNFSSSKNALNFFFNNCNKAIIELLRVDLQPNVPKRRFSNVAKVEDEGSPSPITSGPNWYPLLMISSKYRPLP